MTIIPQRKSSTKIENKKNIFKVKFVGVIYILNRSKMTLSVINNKLFTDVESIQQRFLFMFCKQHPTQDQTGRFT